MTEWNGKRIRDLRKRLGMTQQQFADEAGVVKQQTISEWETDKVVPRHMSQKLLSIMEERSLYGVEKKD